jgi:hypothetical protein
MFDNIEDLPIRPAFGTMRGVMHGVVLNSKPLPGHECISAQPPAELAHLHRPARLYAIWEHVLHLLRNPVEIHHLTGDMTVFNILGSAALIRSASGVLSPFLWMQESLDRPYLEMVDPKKVILQGMPWQWIWFNRVLGFAIQEYKTELELLHIPATVDEVNAYFTWVSRIFRNRIRQHADMSQVRRRIAATLALDPVARRRAHYGLPKGRMPNVATIRDYNNAVLLGAELDQLEHDAPDLLPLYMALGVADDFPTKGEPVQRLKAFFLAHGFKECDWRYIAKCDRRLILPMRHVYECDDVVTETLDYLRIVCDLGLREPIPEPLVTTLFSVWGNPALRSASYAKEYAVHRCYPHIMKLAVARFGKVDFDVLQEELLVIVRWAWDVKLTLTKEQRREGWPWLIKQARAHLAMLDAQERGRSERWPVPAQTLTVGPYQLRFLESSYDLWIEANAMRHCADRYVKKCKETDARIASVTVNQRRVATAMFTWIGEELKLTQIAGKANRPVTAAMSKSLQQLHIDGANERFKELPQEVPIICRRFSQTVEPDDDQVNLQSEFNLVDLKEEIEMTALVTNTGNFIREVEIKPVQAVADTFQVEFRSRLLTAKNPLEPQTNFSLSVDRAGLMELKALIERSLA